jgi:hypothetical protein
MLMAFTPEAQAQWDTVSPEDQAELVKGGFCTRCLATRAFTLDAGEMRGPELALIGHCDTCGGRVVRLIDTSS